MARLRSASVENESQLKRQKTTHDSDYFEPGLLNPASVALLQSSYKQSEPFKHVVIDKLFDDELLTKVKDECVGQLAFTEKETDIYKVKQTGDLASLSYLSPSEQSLFENLRILRDALYSSSFRDFLRAVTGCGPLSGTKQDMSVNSYTTGCHLLNHDDVIGTRRVSYILYMPLPKDQPWKPECGGALELYPTDEDGEPKCSPEKAIPPAWNQFVFFEVQPGRSFHSVQEVVAGNEGTARLSISGWFHAAQPDEEGYEASYTPPAKSSREQLVSSVTPLTPYPPLDPAHPLDMLSLSEEHISFLARFVNPIYLRPSTMKQLAERFVEESQVELRDFLNVPEGLEGALRAVDEKDGVGNGRRGVIPPHEAGTGGEWVVKGPPHKWRYCTLPPSTSSLDTPAAQDVDPTTYLKTTASLLPSPAFRAWLATLTSLLPLAYAVEARRFRPGLDYTLATSEEEEARLDVLIGLTPGLEKKKPKKGKGKGKPGKKKNEDEEESGWEKGEWGGWECYMAPHDEEDDPAVYRSSSSKLKAQQDLTQASGSGSGNSNERPRKNSDSSAHSNAMDEDLVESGSNDTADSDSDSDEGSEDEDDSTLLTSSPSYNTLLLVLRDARVMRFVKYVSALAPGSRWDVRAEFEVGGVEGEGEEEGEDGGDD